jgi:MFS family permease
VADDASSMSSGANPPVGRPDSGEPPGLRAQFGATFAAGKRLLRAHVDLAKAELADIVDEVKRMVALIGAAIGILLIAAFLFLIGGVLFLGEWLFGSIGWGVLLGFLLLADVALLLVLLALDVHARRIGTSFILAAVAGIVVGVLLALNVTNRGWTALGDQVAAAYNPETRTVLLALGISAAVLGILGFLVRIRNGFGAAIGGLVGGALVGVLIGGLTVIEFPVQVGAAIGVLVTLIAAPILAARDVMRTGVDGEALAKKFTPEATIGLTKETIEWVRARMPLVPKS